MKYFNFSISKLHYVRFFALILCCLWGCHSSGEKLIADYGAVADGIANNAVRIQQAIDDLSAKGGGQLVVVPPGIFVSGTIFLKSGIDLHLKQGACLWGPSDYSAYTADCPVLVSALASDYRALVFDDVHNLILSQTKIEEAYSDKQNSTKKRNESEFRHA